MTDDAPSQAELHADVAQTIRELGFWCERYRVALERINDHAELLAQFDPNLTNRQRMQWAAVTDLVDEAFNPRFTKPGDLCGRCGGFGVIDTGTEQRLEDEIVCPECSSGRPDVPF